MRSEVLNKSGRFMAALLAGVLIMGFGAERVSAELPADFESNSAATKQQVLWSKVLRDRYTQLPPMVMFQPEDSKVEFGHSAVQLGQSFDNPGYEIPEGRVKIIHRYGSVAEIEWIAEPNSPYSGLFKTGAIGLARLSLALPWKTVGKFVPGMALMLLVDNQPAKNIVAMNQLEGQAQDQNYFAKRFTNLLPDPTEKATIAGRHYFELFVKDAIHLNVNHVASVTRDGTPEAEPRAPFQLIFQPAAGLALDSNAEDFRLEMAKLPAGTVLYDVYAIAEPGGTDEVLIGHVVSRSEFVASDYGDRRLYFRHEGTPRRSLKDFLPKLPHP